LNIPNKMIFATPVFKADQIDARHKGIVNVFWFRRDLRIDDNIGLNAALQSGYPVLPLFIFDTNITEELHADDARVTFIYQVLCSLNESLGEKGSSILVAKGEPAEVWHELLEVFQINAVFINKDYEPYAIQRDSNIEEILKRRNVQLNRFKDQVIFEERDIVKENNEPYTVFTPYKNRWLKLFELLQNNSGGVKGNSVKRNFLCCRYHFPSIEEIGFRKSNIGVRPYDLTTLELYDRYRDIPSEDKTSYLSPHLRFGTVSIRTIIAIARQKNQVFLGELIWREFFMQILYNYPHVVTGSFKPKYDNIEWRNDKGEFERWCCGETGYPLVDAGMRQLNETGYMHNRVRMVTASFLVKHLLIDWRWGEAYFAGKLLDYELSSNNGNWQWAAGTGCDAAPYFRVFNPEIQLRKFDNKLEYVKRWVSDLTTSHYPLPMVEHSFARDRAIKAYRSGFEY
jgi:deoxyribodipyrimidine photo-lyase